MKNLTKLLAFLFTFVILFSNLSTTEASFKDRIKASKACALIVGGADVKTKDFIERLEENLNRDLDEDIYKKVDCGTQIQSLYQNYWLEKGELEEGKLTKAVLHDFVKFSGYDRCLFLVISEPDVEKTKINLGLFGYAENTRASIEVKAFLADESRVLKIMSTTKNNQSSTSELRSKRGAFTKCIKEVCEEMRPAIFAKKKI